MRQPKPKLKEVKFSVVGQPVAPVVNGDHGAAGRGLEVVFIDNGLPIDRTNVGADLPAINAELKARDINAVSRETVGRSNIDNIISTDWEDSTIREKFQTQIRVYHNGKVVVGQTVCDFSHPLIQQIAKEAYEICRQKLINGDRKLFIHGTKWFSIEAQKSSPGVYALRTDKMKELVAMAKRNWHLWI
jgi:hypothetical protein